MAMTTGPAAIVEGAAALVLAQVLAGSLRDGLTLRQLLTDSGLRVEQIGLALAAEAELRRTGALWRMQQSISASGNAATRPETVLGQSERMTTKQAAEFLHLTERRVRQLAAAGDIPSTRIGRGHVFDGVAVLAFADARAAA
jgi:excisionase family DNA binding protein